MKNMGNGMRAVGMAMLVSIMGLTVGGLGADKVIDTTAPQTTDGAFDLQLRSTKALHDLLVGGITFSGNAGTINADGQNTTNLLMAITNLLTMANSLHVACSNLLQGVLTVNQGALSNTVDHVTAHLSADTAVIGSLLVTNASTGVFQLTADDTITFRTITFFGLKASETLNTGTVWVSIGSDTLFPLSLVSGASATWSAPPGTVTYGTNVWLKNGTENDGVVVNWAR